MGLFDRLFGPPTADKFAQIMAEALRRVGDDRISTYDKAEFRLTFTRNGEQAGVMNLRNLYAEYCKAPKKDRQALLLRTCKGLANPMEIPEDFEDVKPDLLPTVRTRSMLEVMRLDQEVEGNKPLELAWAPLTEHLVVCLVYDLPTSMQFISQETLATWGVSLYEAMECARQNLQEREFLLMCIGEKLFIMESGDAYDGTRLLLTERIRGLPRSLEGQPIAMPISRDCLLITGSDDNEGLGMMATIAEKKKGEARPLCPIPVRLVGEEWETWLPPEDNPHYERFRMLELPYLGEEYARQKELLDKLHENLGQDLFVASFSAAQRDQRVRSFSVWSKGVPTWLPRTQYVALYDPQREFTGVVSWEQLEQTAGHLLEPLDCYPPRWLVSEFPSEEEIEQMQPEDWSK